MRSLPKAKDRIDWQYTFFDQADRFVATVRYIEQIRKRLSPETRTDIDEVGVILSDGDTIPPLYWNAAGALYAYLFIHLSMQEIDVLGESQLIGFPSQFPSVSMVSWETGAPNARFQILSLIKNSIRPGDRILSITSTSPDVDGEAVIASTEKKLLLVNKRNRRIAVSLPHDAEHARTTTVDLTSAGGPPREGHLRGATVTLEPFAVAVVSW